MPTDKPMITEDSILAWEIETQFKSAPANAGWRSFGRVTDWEDLGPRHAVFRDAIAGAGREAHAVGQEGHAFGGVPIGPFQVVDPLVLGFAWGREVNVPVQIGATAYYRHTATPVAGGLLPSMAIHMRDRTQESSPKTDKTTYVGCVAKRLALRGEAVRDDGSGGRVLAALEMLPHADDPAIADKTVTLPTTEPFRFHHGNISLFGEQVFRIIDWEFLMDNQANPSWYWNDSGAPKRPYESPPGGAVYDFRANIVADGETYTVGGSERNIHQILRDHVGSTNGTLLFKVTADQNEFQINLTDLVLADAPKRRRIGQRVVYGVQGIVRSTSLQWVDQLNTRFFPA